MQTLRALINRLIIAPWFQISVQDYRSKYQVLFLISLLVSEEVIEDYRGETSMKQIKALKDRR